MNMTNKTKSASAWMLALGLAAAIARGLTYLLAVDEKGLLVRFHPCAVVLGILCVAALIPSLMQFTAKKTSGKWEDTFASGKASALGSVALAAGIALTVVSGNELARSNLVVLWNVSGVLACLGLIWAAWSRWKGHKPFLPIYAVVCLFLALHMVSRYQPWSGDPQVMDWVFSLLGAVGLTLCAYHLAAFCADCGHRRTFLTLGLLTVFCCCAALPNTDCPGLYLGGLVWAFTALWEVAPAKREEG